MPHGCNLPCHFRCWKTLESAALIQNVTFYHIQLLLLVQSFCRCNKSQRHPQTSRGRKRKNTHTHTHLPPAFAWALTLVSGLEAEAAGTAVRVGRVKEEGTLPTGVTPDTSNIHLQTWQPQQKNQERGSESRNDFNQIEEKRKFKFKRKKKK